MNELIKDLEQYLEDNREKYQIIVVENGWFGDSITYSLYYQEAKEIISFIKNIQEENEKLKDRIDKAIKIIKSYNLGKYDYSIPQIGIIELFEALKGEK